MRILIVTPHFFPERFKCNDMATHLAQEGHDVTVMTAIPDYPDGHYHEGYGIFHRRRETIDGVKVRRSFIIPRGDGGKLRLVANYLSYTLFSSLRAIRMSFAHRFDAIIVHEVSPVMVGLPGLIVSKMHRSPMLFWVLDVWPESLQAAGGINNDFILGVFRSLTRRLYKSSSHILISSRGFSRSICSQGDFEDRIHYFPNWIDKALEEVGDEAEPPFKMPEGGFNLVFAGNIGDAQDMPALMNAAKILRDKPINFILVGGGRREDFVRSFIAEHHLQRVYLPGQFPISSMPGLFRAADALFLSLKKNPIFELTVPAKLQAYMSAGRPIIAMIDGEGADLIDEAQCGFTVPAGDYESLAELLVNVSGMSKEERVEYGKRGQTYAKEHFSFSRCMDNLHRMLGL